MVKEGFLHKEIYEDLIVSDNIAYSLDALCKKTGTSGAAPFLKKPERRKHN